MTMSKLEELKREIRTLDMHEKGILYEFMNQMHKGSFTGIETNPRINGGEPCIIRTRIPVWMIIRAEQLGTTDAELLQNFPTLRAEDIVNARGYYYFHGAAIEQQIRENEAD